MQNLVHLFGGDCKVFSVTEKFMAKTSLQKSEFVNIVKIFDIQEMKHQEFATKKEL